jgi:hypothetical protein
VEYDKHAEPLENIARGLFAIAHAINRLGLANASTPMGALELLSMELKRLADAHEGIASTLGDVVPVSLHGDNIEGIHLELRAIAEKVDQVLP